MSQITTEQLKQLRDETGVSVMQCKKALEEAGGDMEKAVLILKKKSSDIAAKKADREAHDGIVVVKKDAGKVATCSQLWSRLCGKQQRFYCPWRHTCLCRTL